MFDIRFFQNTFDLKKEIVAHKRGIRDHKELFSLLERQRNHTPNLFNIETTNNCNMTCEMCPRTTEMIRKVENMDREVFKSVAAQLFPHRKKTFDDWIHFVGKELGIHPEERGENPFYFFISSQAITMHGFGEPILDPFLKERVEILSQKDIPTYFSCNPSNINSKRIESLFQAGLKYIKFSVLKPFIPSHSGRLLEISFSADKGKHPCDNL